jgi:hypothetical protein
MRVMEEDAIREEDATPWSFFAPVTDALQFRANNVLAAKKLSTDIAPLLRECFTLSWAKIRERRLGELRRARAQLGRLEKQRAALEVAKGKLEEAVNLLDMAAFERLAAEAVAEKLVPQAQVDQLEKRLVSRLEKAEAPLRQLVASRCRQQQARGGAAARGRSARGGPGRVGAALRDAFPPEQGPQAAARAAAPDPEGGQGGPDEGQPGARPACVVLRPDREARNESSASAVTG